MRMAVCIKQVPGTPEKSLLPDGSIRRDAQAAAMNQADVFAMETAVMLKERHGGRIDVLTMGTESAVNILKETVAMGADRIFLLSDRAFAGADTYATALVLSTALQKLGAYDLIFCGRKTLDGETGQVPVQIAEMLGILAVTNVVGIEAQEGRICCRRLLEDCKERQEIQFPVVVSIMEGIEGIGHPRLPSLECLRKAVQEEIVLLDRHSLGLPEETVGVKGSFTEVRRVYFPDWDRECRFFGMEEGIEQTLEVIRQAKEGG